MREGEGDGQCNEIFFKNGPNQSSFCLFSHDKCSKNLAINEGRWYAWTRTRGGRMVGADESTELWCHPHYGYEQILVSTENLSFTGIEPGFAVISAI